LFITIAPASQTIYRAERFLSNRFWLTSVLAREGLKIPNDHGTDSWRICPVSPTPISRMNVIGGLVKRAISAQSTAADRPESPIAGKYPG